MRTEPQFIEIVRTIGLLQRQSLCKMSRMTFIVLLGVMAWVPQFIQSPTREIIFITWERSFNLEESDRKGSIT